MLGIIRSLISQGSVSSFGFRVSGFLRATRNKRETKLETRNFLIMQTTVNRFAVGDYIIEPQLNRITGPEGVSVVEPKVMHVLTCMATQPGNVLTKDALIKEVWEGTVVTDYVVSRSISQLRKIFSDSFKDPQYIETVSKTGYRLIAPVSFTEPGSDGSSATLPSGDSRPASAASIEVVPSINAPHKVLEPAAKTSSSNKIAVNKIAVVLAVCLVALLAWTGLQLLPGQPSAPFSAALFTSSPGLEMAPVFSPDGSMVAFVRFNTDTRLDVYVKMVDVKMVDSQVELRLTDHPGSDGSPTWSADGKKVIFQRTDQEACGVYEVSALGGMERKIMDCTPGQYHLNMAPDGSAILTTEPTDRPGDRRITLVDTESLQRTPITNPPPSASDFLPAFSPDGEYIAFCRGLHGTIEDLYIVPASGGEPQRLTFDDRDIAGFSWTPDGESLVFSSNKTGHFRLWKIDISGGEPTWVSDVATLDPGSPSFSSTGSHLAYEEWTFELNIWEVSIDGSLVAEPDDAPAMARKFASTRSDVQPSYSPDGKQVAFVSNRSGQVELWIGAQDGSHQSALVSLDGAYLQMPRWSPDGQHITFEAFQDGRAQVYTVDAKGGKPRRLLHEEAEQRFPYWSKNGQWIYFTSNREDGWQIWKTTPSGAELTRVTSNGGYFMREAHDGANLYYSKLGQVGLWRQDSDGSEELILKDLKELDWGNWALSTSDIYYFSRQEGAVSISRYSFEDSSTTSIASIPPFRVSHEQGLTLSPDGDHLLLSLTDRSESDIMLVEIDPKRRPWE